uniref:IMPACT-like protein n=1 Tax=Magallana gigas TaxID=29159 RepID=K1QN75_MAGGI
MVMFLTISVHGAYGHVNIALQSLPIIQKTLQGIQDRLNGLEGLRLEIQSEREALNENLWGADGIGPKLEHVAQQAEGTSEDVDSIYRENQSLRLEVDLLKAIVIKLDRKVDEKQERGSRFMASGAAVKTYGEVRNLYKLYKKICSLPKHAQANHRILVYRFRDKDRKLIEGSMDDGEFGAGRNLLKRMEERGYENFACVLTRWYSGEHLGIARFGQMREGVDQVSQKLGK